MTVPAYRSLCCARVGFYRRPCPNRSQEGAHFCGVHQAQEEPLLAQLAAHRAQRRAKAAARAAKDLGVAV